MFKLYIAIYDSAYKNETKVNEIRKVKASNGRQPINRWIFFKAPCSPQQPGVKIQR